jgi:hypothetical protein
MEKIRIKVDEEAGWVEVDGFRVPDTEGLFAITDPANELGDLTHVSTGLAVLKSVPQETAACVASQLFTACPEAWRQTEPEAVVARTPKLLSRWYTLVRKAIDRIRDIPFDLLRSYDEYRAAAVASVRDIADVVDREATADFPPAPDAVIDTRPDKVFVTLWGVYALDADRRIAKRYARWEHAREALTFREQTEGDNHTHLAWEMTVLGLYWARPGVTKEEAVAAYNADHPDATLDAYK